MARSGAFRLIVIALLSMCSYMCAPSGLFPAGPADTLKLLISVEQQSITAPIPARVTLHLHNAGEKTLWLYRRARN